MEQRTTRLTLLIDPKKKALFEELCALEDVTPSQKVRQFIRDYIEQHKGTGWQEKYLADSDSDRH
ncbi:MAG: CopG family transcriptional regulator [Hahellaceae bacterium]|nr:CopG family transcriptional regulator [Hahellaceae bacterium]MCP5169907.1 CopG family transcriptional regulator [Hahellaceae bacterium]